jgi:hypothetical protein
MKYLPMMYSLHMLVVDGFMMPRTSNAVSTVLHIREEID